MTDKLQAFLAEAEARAKYGTLPSLLEEAAKEIQNLYALAGGVGLEHSMTKKIRAALAALDHKPGKET